MTNTSVLIRVQARGGKFLGPGVGYSNVSVWNGGTCLFEAVAKGDSGTVDPKTGDPFPPAASRNVIAVLGGPPGPPRGAYWLTSDSGTAGVLATFALDEPTLLEFRASAFSDTVTTSAMMWVIPGMQLTSEPGLVLEIPGLHVLVDVRPAADAGLLAVKATVTMMCGCPITDPTWPQQPDGPEPYWPSNEFTVVANLQTPDGRSASRTMSFVAENTFTTTFPYPAVGESIVSVSAVQTSETNVGFARQSFVAR